MIINYEVVSIESIVESGLSESLVKFVLKSGPWLVFGFANQHARSGSYSAAAVIGLARLAEPGMHHAPDDCSFSS